MYATIAALCAKICPRNRTDFYPTAPQFDSNHRVHFSTPTYCQSVTFGPLAFCVCPLFFTTKNQKEFRIATVPIFRCDLYAAVFPQMSPPPPTKNCARLRTTTNDYAQLSTMVDFIVLSIKLVFMVLGVSYSRVAAQLVSPMSGSRRSVSEH